MILTCKAFFAILYDKTAICSKEKTNKNEENTIYIRNEYLITNIM